VISVWSPDGVPEVRRGADLAALLTPLVELADGDIVCVTSKVVSKSEGQVSEGDRAAALAGETVRVVARRGPLAIVVNRQGLTMAAAGIDASNVEPGLIVLLPDDPDASARRLRADLATRTGRNVGVLVTDTAGRPWREGQTDIAVGAAGVVVLDDHVGRTDPYGNELMVTAPAVGDELAGAAELASGKLSGRPFTIIRGQHDLVLPVGEDGAGAASLIRQPGTDLFGLGAREAVLAALSGRDREAFGTPVDAAELAGVLHELTGIEPRHHGDGLAIQGLDERGRWLVETAAHAHGWVVDNDSAHGVGLRPSTP
jgi:coenzyme F420-0:L-glutamate ligase/coenzyme F420-1:gamma-L-glutamate ligase